MTGRNFKIVLEYDGRHFSGWQRQAPGDGPTVQGVLEAALSRLCAHPVTVHGSGRTDAGVHARGQTASFATAAPRTPDQIVRGANCLLPPAAAILAAEEVPADFHARFSAVGKVYEYDLLTSAVRRPLRAGRAWWVGPGLDWAAVAEALPRLVGEHDFSAFQSAGSEVGSAVRELRRVELAEGGEEIKRLIFEGSGFLRHMVRALTGTLVEVAKGRRTPESLTETLAARQRGLAGPTAPPDGLYLARVIYPPG